MNDTQATADVQLLRGSLGDLPEPSVNPAFIIVSGLPGSGKSYLCRRLAERLELPILESDVLRRLLFPSPDHRRRESERLFRACHLLLEELLRKGIPLIFDATNLVERHREHLYRIADGTGARLVIVRVEAPPEVVRERLRKRRSENDLNDNSGADWEVYRRMSATSQRIRRKHFTVDTSRDIAPVIDKIVREANR
jgi:predicted kinase